MVKCCGDSFVSRANQQLLLQSPADVEDDSGGHSQGWADVATVWAIVEPMAGREIYVSAQQQSRCDARITIRYRPALSDTREAGRWRLKLGDRAYNILASKNLNRDMKREGTDYQQLFCVEGE